MRRKDREITESDRIQKIIDACQCMRIALADGACAYIVPVNFGYDKAGKAFYFHGAAKGRKIDLIRQNGYQAGRIQMKQLTPLRGRSWNLTPSIL